MPPPWWGAGLDCRRAASERVIRVRTDRDTTTVTVMEFDADVLVIGSGFGGAASALRLTEAGHRVIVLERGKRLSNEDLLRARTDPRA